MTDNVEQKIVVRPAEAADAAAVAQVHITSREVAMPWLPPRTRTVAEVERWVREVVLVESDVWVAVDGGGAVLGYAAVEGEWLEHLYLLPQVRRRGIGSLLLARAKEHRPDRLDLHVFQRNTDAREFYARHGFTVVDLNDGSRNMEHEPDMTLRWTPVTNGTSTDGSPSGARGRRVSATPSTRHHREIACARRRTSSARWPWGRPRPSGTCRSAPRE